MHWVQVVVFCGGLLYAAVDDLKTRTVNDITCIIIASAGLITISPASFWGALLCMLPFYICAGIGVTGGGDWRLAAAIGFVLRPDRMFTGLCFMVLLLLAASLLTKVFPSLQRFTSGKQPLVPYFAAAFIPAYFI